MNTARKTPAKTAKQWPRVVWNRKSDFHEHRKRRSSRPSQGALVALCVAWGAICFGCNSVSKRNTACDTCPVEQRVDIDGGQHADFPAARKVFVDPGFPADQMLQRSAQSASYPFTPPIAVGVHPEQQMAGDYNDPSRTPTQYEPVADLTANRTADGNAPNIAGTHFGTAQITATEHALRLKKENELLQLSRASVLADNQRLRDQLNATKDLLERMKSAMTGAQEELENAAHANLQLKQKVAELERQQKRNQLDTERMLESIRGELDDVLMREMALKRND